MNKIQKLQIGKWEFPDDEFADYQTKGRRMKNVSVVGMDTETNRGKPFLFSYSLSDTDKGYSIVDKNNWLKVLTNKKFRSKVNFFYNMQYDVEGFLKYLDDDYLAKLYYSKYIELDDGTTINYIPKKFLRIKKGSAVFKYYDLLQYFLCKLGDAAKTYLGMDKTGDYGETMDYQRFQRDGKYKNTIIEYCIQDSVLCRKLAEKLFSYFIERGYTNFISSASLSEEYFRRNGLPVSPDIPEKTLRNYLKSYYGGRFEVLKRGMWKNVREYDLNSAYPSIMADMPILTNSLKIKESRDWDCPLYGSYDIEVEIPEDSYYGLVPYRQNDGLVVFPTGKMECTVTYPEMCMIDRLGLDYELIHSTEIHDENAQFLLKKPITELYMEKEKAKRNHDDVRYHQLKIILNSLYGKFIQANEQKDIALIDENEDFKDDDELVHINDVLYKIVYKGEFKLGRLFNPAYASYITGATRCKLVKDLYDKELIAFHTDSVLTTKSMDTGSAMNQWSLKASGDSYIIKTGYYKIGDKVKNRGVHKFRLGKDYENRRVGLGSAIRRHLIPELNVIKPFPVVVKNEDRKRQWYKIASEQMDSDPLTMSLLMESEHTMDLKRMYKDEYKRDHMCLKKYIDENEIDPAFIDSTLTNDENVHNLRNEWKNDAW